MDSLTHIINQIRHERDSFKQENEVLRIEAQEIPVQRTKVKYITRYQADLTLEKTVKRLHQDSIQNARKLKTLQEQVVAITQGQDSLISTLYRQLADCIDSSQVLPIDANYQDSWSDVSVNITRDSARWKVSMREELDIRHSMKNPLFSGPVWTTSISSLNPYISGAKAWSYAVRDKRRFGFGLSLGYGLGLNGNQLIASPFAGLGVNWNLVRF